MRFVYELMSILCVCVSLWVFCLTHYLLLLFSEMKEELEDLMLEIKKNANKVRAKLKGKWNTWLSAFPCFTLLKKLLFVCLSCFVCPVMVRSCMQKGATGSNIYRQTSERAQPIQHTEIGLIWRRRQNSAHKRHTHPCLCSANWNQTFLWTTNGQQLLSRPAWMVFLLIGKPIKSRKTSN